MGECYTHSNECGNQTKFAGEGQSGGIQLNPDVGQSYSGEKPTGEQPGGGENDEEAGKDD